MGPFDLVTGGVHCHQPPDAVCPGALGLGGEGRPRGEPGRGEVSFGAEAVHLTRHSLCGLLELCDVGLGTRELLAETRGPTILAVRVGVEHLGRPAVPSSPCPVRPVAQRPGHLLHSGQLAPQSGTHCEERRGRAPQLGCLAGKVRDQVVVRRNRIRRRRRTPAKPAEGHPLGV